MRSRDIVDHCRPQVIAQNMEIPLYRFLVYLLIAQVIIGILLGLIPFFLGRNRGRSRLGNYGLLVSIIGGAVSPLLAIIAVIVFTWLIYKKPAAPAGAE